MVEPTSRARRSASGGALRLKGSARSLRKTRVPRRVLDGPGAPTVAVSVADARLAQTLGAIAQQTGVTGEALLSGLERAASGVDIFDRSHGFSVAEAESFAEAGIDLAGHAEDPAGVLEIMTGKMRVGVFRDRALTATEAAVLLGVTPGRVRQMMSEGALLPLPQEDKLIPSWQIVDGRAVPGLRLLRDPARELHPLSLGLFMERPDPDLDVAGSPASPIDWLVSGGDPQVVAALLAGLSVAG